ncbi:MAG: hypothetical protein OHK0052_06140 [Anaerolineales bacterium]
MKPILNLLKRLFGAPFALLRGIWRILTHLWGKIYHFLTDEIESDNPVTEAFSHAIEKPAELLPHLVSLRKRILQSLLILAITIGISFTFAGQILVFLASPLEGGLQTLQAIEVTEPISVFMRVALLSGIALALPFILLQIVLFIGPGLRRRTRLLLLFIALPASLALFLSGMAFAFWVMLPVALPFLINFLGINTLPRPYDYIRFVTGVMFWMGIAFQLPLFTYIVARLGYVRAQTLAKHWRIAVVIIAILAAAITPTIDPVNMAIVMLPLTILYFLSVGLAFIARR